MASPEDWFEQLTAQLTSSRLAPGEREFELFQARQQFTSLLFRDRVVSRLYADWYRRTEPEGRVRYSISDLASFCLLAGAAGIVGNAAYDALKSFVRSLLRKRAGTFESMVTEAKYEEIRAELHSGKPATVEIDDSVTLLVRRRYWILVKTGKPRA